LSENFNEYELKNAKKIVLRLHPDKSGLPSEYFLFYSKAYKIVYSIYKHKNKSDKNANTEVVEEYSMVESQNKVLDTFFESNNVPSKSKYKLVFCKVYCFLNCLFNLYKMFDSQFIY
jgi:hypothetical protein